MYLFKLVNIINKPLIRNLHDRKLPYVIFTNKTPKPLIGIESPKKADQNIKKVKKSDKIINKLNIKPNKKNI